jgi:ERCC4-related helicase
MVISLCSPSERDVLWSSKRVIFSTPQTMENDLTRGSINPLRLVCIVIDEAHRAVGNYAYATLMRLLTGLNTNIRVLALSATPGSDFIKIQNVIEVLNISKIEVRTEDDPDIRGYCYDKQVEIIPCKSGLSAGLASLRHQLDCFMEPVVKRLFSDGVLDTTSAKMLNSLALDDAIQ